MRVLWLGLLILITSLPGCGGDSGDDSGEHVVTGFSYELSIDGPEIQSNTDPGYQYWLDSEGRWFLEGDGFLPPGTTCGQRTCTDSLGYTSSAYIGQNELTWENMTTGGSGIISEGSKFESSLYWYCYCDAPPHWSAYIPVALGQNRIIVTQSAGGTLQQDEVLVMIE
jgi:hypothetical protein